MHGFKPVPVCTSCTVPLSEDALTTGICSVCSKDLRCGDGGMVVDLQINVLMHLPKSLDEIFIDFMTSKDERL